jgi:hypothetical protein
MDFSISNTDLEEYAACVVNFKLLIRKSQVGPFVLWPPNISPSSLLRGGYLYDQPRPRGVRPKTGGRGVRGGCRNPRSSVATCYDFPSETHLNRTHTYPVNRLHNRAPTTATDSRCKIEADLDTYGRWLS